MHFGRPENLHFLWGIPVVATFLLWSLRDRRRKLELLISAEMVPRLTLEFSRRKTILKAVLLLACFSFSILALARPQWGARMETVRRHGVDVVVALDTSFSMNAEDVAPSRLEKAKGEIRALISTLRGDRVGLVVFAGTAVVQCPLTLDYGAAKLFLDMINTEIVPEPGTSLSAAILTANAAFSAKERKYKVLILITDGEDLEGQVDAALQQAKESGIIIYTVGVGSPEGRPIPVRDENGSIVEYRKDSNGQVVVSRLDERALARIAVEAGGKYYRASTSASELDAIYDDVSRLEKKELESRVFQNLEDRFQYPLALALLCLALEIWTSDRRRTQESWIGRLYRERVMKNRVLQYLMVLAFLLGAPSAFAAGAGKNREGNRLYQQGKFEEAEKAYLQAQSEMPDRPELQYNLGNALLRQKKFPQGIQSLQKAVSKADKGLQASSWYNSGNALYEMKKYQEAAQAYIHSLRLNPSDREAKHNLELALKKVEEQKQQQPGKGSGKNDAQSQDSKQKQQEANEQKAPPKDKENQQAPDNQQQQNENKPVSPGSTQAERKNESFSKDRALQILDALENQELAEQRKLLQQRAKRKVTGRDW